MGDLVDAKELAIRLKVTPATVHAWHRRGWIPCLRAGRRPVLFDIDAVEHALRQRTKRQRTSDSPDNERKLAARIVALFSALIEAWQIDNTEEVENNRFQLEQLGVNVEVPKRRGAQQ